MYSEYNRTRAELIRRKYEAEGNELDKVFTREERLRMAYVPVIMAESIWVYVNKVLTYCRKNKIDQVKKLSRAVQTLQDSYYDFLRQSIDQHHLDRAKETAAEFMQAFSWQIKVTWFTVDGELLRLYPEMNHRSMRADAHCAILLVRVLKDFCADVSDEIRERMGQGAEVLNPKLGNLDTIMDGYIGPYEIDRTELVKRCEVVMRNAMETIKYKE